MRLPSTSVISCACDCLSNAPLYEGHYAVSIAATQLTNHGAYSTAEEPVAFTLMFLGVLLYHLDVSKQDHISLIEQKVGT